MKRIFLASMLLATTLFSANAQEDKNIFNHMGMGIEIGTTGVGLEIAAPITNFVAVRTGVSYLPTIKVKNIKVDVSGQQISWQEGQKKATEFKNDYYQYLTSEDKAKIDKVYNIFTSNNLPSDVLVDGKLSMFNWKFLFDVYPFKNSAFRITAGFYYGKSQIIEAYTTNCQQNFEAVTSFNQTLAGTTMSATNPVTGKTLSYTFHEKYGIQMGDYLLEPNGEQVKGYLRTSSFKPYVGLGFGRAVPQKHRFAFNCDLGVMFWNTPKIYADQPGGEVQIDKNGVKGDGGVIKAISKITVYPCLNFRLTGRLF